jgi:hypothetical protein
MAAARRRAAGRGRGGRPGPAQALDDRPELLGKIARRGLRLRQAGDEALPASRPGPAQRVAFEPRRRMGQGVTRKTEPGVGVLEDAQQRHGIERVLGQARHEARQHPGRSARQALAG